MDIIITDSSLRKFLETKADIDTLTRQISLCGPTFDRLKKIDGDAIYEIEAITNRVDTASAQGVAREAAVILSQQNIPAKMINDPYLEKISFRPGLPKQFHFEIEKDLVVRFVAVALENISVKDSPLETKNFLENCGQRFLNNCIDITNELTLLYGMPSHIFDLDKLAAQHLLIRESREGEILTTLDNQKNLLKGGDIIIEDGSGKLVDLCGVMGGDVAMVDRHTKNILLIVPVYQPQKVRRTSLLYQKRTLAAQLYEKSPDPDLCLPVISKAVELFKKRAGAEVSSSLFDFYPATRPPKLISLNFHWLNLFVGIEFKREEVISILSGLGFAGIIEEDDIICTVPGWRYHDINIREDLAEEVARIYGYFRLPSVLPCVNLKHEPKNQLLQTELKAKKYLSAAGFHEIYNNSLVSLELIQKTAQNPDIHFKLKNALVSDFEYLRTTLTPSSLENHKHNQGKINDPLQTYELANTYQKIGTQELPEEVSTLSLLSGSPYREAKGYIESLLEHLKVTEVSFRPSKHCPPFFATTGTADIFSQDDYIGSIGHLKPVVLRNLGLHSSPTACEINIKSLIGRISRKDLYRPVSEFPLVLEDITVSSDKFLGSIIETIKNTSPLIKEIVYLDSFKDKHTFSVSFGHDEKNLDQKVINLLKEKILDRFQS